MKKTITIFAISFLTAIAVLGKTWTVSNNPDIPAQFTQIVQAVESGSLLAGDTLLVAGSSTRYDNFTLNEPLVIIGAGINNPYGFTTRVSYVYLYTSAGFTPSGTKLSGLVIESGLYLNGDQAGGGHVVENVTIERCSMHYYFDFGGNSSIFRNDTIRNCYLKNYDCGFANASYEGIAILNCLFDNKRITQGTNADLSNVTLLNNVFINETQEIFPGINNLVVENNIFFKALPQGCTGCTFNSNTSYGSSNNVLPGVGNLGDGQNNDVNPLFVKYTTSDAAFGWDLGLDFNLQGGSPCIGTGVGSTDRGMYGGPMPIEFGTNPSIPQMTDIIFTDDASSVKEEGTLNVKFKAKKQD